jgi:sec-independent protein translocase protein TatA
MYGETVMMISSGLVGFGMPSLQELIPIMVILILFFGAARLPQLARSIGRSITEFKRGRDDTTPLPEDPGSGNLDSTPDSKSED